MLSNIVSTLVLLILDGIWVGTYMSSQYSKQVMAIQKSSLKANMAYAVLSYMLMVVGLNLFVLPRIRKSHALTDSLIYGALFGLVLYGVYDLTAAAVLKDWDIKLALIDMAWGSFVFFISAYIGSFFM
tara:strand:- start:35 stop:418 length:384 start_codon:yes stop_codon:yes gene_type:complete